MTCDRAIRLVEKLADAEAKPSERTEAEAHLESCEDCRSHYQFVRALESASEKIDWQEPPEAYWQHLPMKVLARLEREQPAKRRSFWQKLLTPLVLRFGAVAATLSVVIAVGFSVIENDQPQLEPDIANRASRAQTPASTSRQVDEKAAGVSVQPAPVAGVSDDAAPEPETSADAPPSPTVERASVVPEESGLTEPALRTPPARAESLDSRPASLQTLPPVELAQLREVGLADRERPADVTTGAGLEGVVADQSLKDAPVQAPPSGGRENRLLRSFAEVPGEPGKPDELNVASEEATNAERTAVDAFGGASVESGRKQARSRAVAPVSNRCAEWRDYLARNGDEGRDSLEARYQVALCSLESYASEQSDEARAAAVREVEAFLAVESNSDRADDVRSRAERLR